MGGKQVFLNHKALNEDILLDDVIMEAKGECCLYISSPSKPAEFIMSQSVSAAANNKDTNPIMNKMFQYGIYSHHLAVTVYDAWSSSINAFNPIVEKFQRILSVSTHPVLLSYEKLYTSCLSVELGQFLLPYNCLHQSSLKHKTDQYSVGESVPDFYCTTVDQGVPSTPLVVADFKMDDNDFNKAKSQSFGYAQDVMTYSVSKRPIVAIPGTRKRFALYLCFSLVSNGPNLITVQICDASVVDNEEMERFFRALKCAVHTIAINGYSGIFAVQPTQDLHLELRLSSSIRVFLLNNKVYKLYDLNQLTPRVDVMDKICFNYFEMTKHTLSKDNKIVYYTSRYIRQKEKDELKLDDFKPIMCALDQLHSCRYVHSDVRTANILFPSDGTDAKLIDFDLAGQVDEPYPSGFNKIEERHESARAGFPRLIIHDRYSIVFIIEKLKFYSDFTECQKCILSKVKTGASCHCKLIDIYNSLIVNTT